MTTIARMLTGLLTRSAWLLEGVWLLAGELLRRSGDPGLDVYRRGGHRRVGRLARPLG